MTRSISGALALVPTAGLGLCCFTLAWREQGSILAEDWLAYALASGLLAATLLASSAALRPSTPCLIGLGGFAAFALWTALSASWSPVPALARDETLLICFYGFVVCIPLLTLRSEAHRLAGAAVVVAASVALAVGTFVRLMAADGVSDLYWHGRLAAPIGYPGAETAMYLVSFWPAVAMAASRRLPTALRTFAFAGAVVLLAGWLMTQSRAGAVSLLLSALVVFAVAPGRLRLLVPVGLAGLVAGASYGPLTEPFRRQADGFEEAISDAGRWALLLAVVGVSLGLVYVLADRRLTLPEPFVRTAGLVAVCAIAACALVGLGSYLVAVDEPGGYLADRWDEFKRQPDRETGSSHLVTFGSNRYDTWRVALNDFREHPFGGVGGRSFGTVYLREGNTTETPRRAHSLELDLLMETGVPGIALLAAALLPFLWILLRRATSNLVAAGVLGGAAYWLIHASGDWIWTFPAAGALFFLLLGSGSARDDPEEIGSRVALPAGLVLGAAALLLFVPPWLSARYTASALEQTGAAATDDLRRARWLDPLATDPLVAEAELAGSPEDAIPPLREAVEREPRTMALRYLLGRAYLDAGRREEAKRQLREAQRLAPRSEAVRRALARLRE